jgi:hypothetical protein
MRFVFFMAFVGCSNAPPPVPPQASASVAPVDTAPVVITPDDVATGRDCAKATSLCGEGACEVKLKNDCETPLTCNAFILVRCKAANDFIEASGRGRETFPAKTEGKLTVESNCTMGSIVQTSFTELKCN